MVCGGGACAVRVVPTLGGQFFFFLFFLLLAVYGAPSALGLSARVPIEIGLAGACSQKEGGGVRRWRYLSMSPPNSTAASRTPRPVEGDLPATRQRCTRVSEPQA